MAKRLGTVLVFKTGVARARAEKLLAELAATGVLEGSHRVDGATHRIEEFDDEYGGPVWYIP